MTYGDSPRSYLSSHCSQKRIAQFPSSFLERAFPLGPVGSYVLSADSDGNAQQGSQARHVFSVGFGFNSAQLVIEMSYVKFYP
jgi:hypothetical protein